MPKMRMSFAVLGLMAGCEPLAAQEYHPYPWCAQYYDSGGGRDCSFESFAQCLETARGGGAYCDRNYLYPAPEPQPAAGQPAPPPTAAKKPPRKRRASLPAPQ